MRLKNRMANDKWYQIKDTGEWVEIYPGGIKEVSDDEGKAEEVDGKELQKKFLPGITEVKPEVKKFLPGITEVKPEEVKDERSLSNFVYDENQNKVIVDMYGNKVDQDIVDDYIGEIETLKGIKEVKTMRLKNRMMKLANENKEALVNEMAKKLKPKWQEMMQESLDEFTKPKGIKAEIDFDFYYEYYAEEDEESLVVDGDKSKIKKIEIIDEVDFAEKFNYNRYLNTIGISSRDEKQDDEYDIMVEDLIIDIDIYNTISNTEITVDGKSNIICRIPDNYVFILDNDNEFKEYGITPKLSRYIKSKLEDKIQEDITKTIYEYIEIEIEAEATLIYYSPLRILERGEQI
jgi:hypothetical protein